jgi:hypothetical protein
MMRHSYRFSAFAALLTLAAMIWMRLSPGDPIAADLPQGFSQPMIAFEFADASIVHRLFFESGDRLKTSFVEHMKYANYRDFAFMAGYGFFLFFFAWRNRTALGSLAVPALALACCAPLADAMENVQLLGILGHLPDEKAIGNELTLLKVFTWIKWLALAVYPVLLVPTLVRSGLAGRLVAFVFVLCLVLGLAALAFYTPGLLNQFTRMVIVNLGGMMVFGLYKGVREMLMAQA